ncbi:hypothetical protein ACFQY7_06550 [Actinomadura luteofluorescens]|uniref:hypothetical protein n=1 Tax=Actinomadura luteofluorescens TaxID=46163 RepID=UPI00363FD247
MQRLVDRLADAQRGGGDAQLGAGGVLQLLGGHLDGGAQHQPGRRGVGQHPGQLGELGDELLPPPVLPAAQEAEEREGDPDSGGDAEQRGEVGADQHEHRHGAERQQRQERQHAHPHPGRGEAAFHDPARFGAAQPALERLARAAAEQALAGHRALGQDPAPLPA